MTIRLIADSRCIPLSNSAWLAISCDGPRTTDLEQGPHVARIEGLVDELETTFKNSVAALEDVIEVESVARDVESAGKTETATDGDGQLRRRGIERAVERVSCSKSAAGLMRHRTLIGHRRRRDGQLEVKRPIVVRRCAGCLNEAHGHQPSSGLSSTRSDRGMAGPVLEHRRRDGGHVDRSSGAAERAQH